MSSGMSTLAASPWYLAEWVSSVPAVVAVGAAVVIALVRHRRQQAREESAKRGAEARGWRWERLDPTLVDRWDLDPFGKGRGRRAHNVIRGEHRGWSFVAFDYRYNTGASRSRRKHDVVVYAITLPAGLPKLEAGPEGVFGGRVARAFGLGGVRTGDEDLDTTWKIEAENEQFADALFHDRMRQLLRQTGAWSWGFDGATMLSHHDGHLDVERDLIPRLDLMATVLGEVPDDAWRTGNAWRAGNAPRTGYDAGRTGDDAERA